MDEDGALNTNGVKGDHGALLVPGRSYRLIAELLYMHRTSSI
jgi:hypothetical protein